MSHIATASARSKHTQKLPSQSSKARRITREQLLRSLKIIGTIPAPLPPELPPSPPASRSASPAPHHRGGNSHTHNSGANVNGASSSKRKLDTDPRSDTDSVKRFKTKHAASASTSSASSTSIPLRHKQQQQQQAEAASSLSPGSSRGEDTAATPNPNVTQLTQTPSSSAHPSGAVTLSIAALSSLRPPNAPTTTTTTNPAPTAGASGSSSLPTPHMPVRRPRRGKGTVQDFDRIHDHYHALGRKFKYSGEARFWSTYPPSHKHFKALQKPPAPGTPYHTHGGLMSRLELTEALVCFVYAIWCQEYPRNKCDAACWESIESFLAWCRTKWMTEQPIGIRENAFVGLIHMIEAFIHQRKVQYAVNSSLYRKVSDINKTIRQEQRQDGLDHHTAQQLQLQHQQQQQAMMMMRNGAMGVGVGVGAGNTQVSPPGMLPSPAGTASANSTPQNSGNGSPEAGAGGHNSGGSSSRRSPSVASTATAVNTSRNTHPPLPAQPPTPIAVPIPSPLLTDIHSVLFSTMHAASRMKASQSLLSLPLLREHFPRTFGRMVNSSLGANDEYEPDMEDDEGELFWPGQSVTGEGLGWVCLMGRSMVREFGREVGYGGVEGVVEKPGGMR